MKKIMTIIGAMTIIAFVYMGSNALASGMNESTSKTYQVATQPMEKTHNEAALGVGKDLKNCATNPKTNENPKETNGSFFYRSNKLTYEMQ